MDLTSTRLFCRGIFQQLKDTLTLPEECKKTAQQSSLGYLFTHGERHILPSFFNLLMHLQKQASTPDLNLSISLGLEVSFLQWAIRMSPLCTARVAQDCMSSALD